MKKITKIEPDRRITNKKIRVAAYCRVSTDQDKQMASLKVQKSHYVKYINEHEGWSFAGLYYDAGISGTSIDKRPELLRLLRDCELGRIDFIVTKSISRFARNTTDSLGMIRKLQALDIPIYFEKENINSAHIQSELLVSIMSQLAEDESRSISKNMKWGIRNRFQNGTYIISTPPYGYENHNGQLVVNPAEAEIVREIFQDILSGMGAYQIAKEMEKRRVPTKRGGKWSCSTVYEILENEIYIGDLRLQKNYMDDNFRRRKNHGELNQYYIQDDHEPIISREAFASATLIIDRKKMDDAQVDKSKYQNRYPFSGKIICAECGRTMIRRFHYTGSRQYVSWDCKTHLEDKDSCSMRFITDEAVKSAFTTMINKLIFGSEIIVKPFHDAMLKSSICVDVEQLDRLNQKIKRNEKEQDILQEVFAKECLAPGMYNQENMRLIAEHEELEESKRRAVHILQNGFSGESEISKLYHFSRKAKIQHEFSDDLFTRFVDHALVYSREMIGFQLKCGLLLKERMVWYDSRSLRVQD
jgi:site-specific DNA recombinase